MVSEACITVVSVFSIVNVRTWQCLYLTSIYMDIMLSVMLNG